MKRWTMIAVLVLSLCLLSGCQGTSVPDQIKEEVGIDVSGGTELSTQDTHGGFHGDGISCYVYTFSDDSCLQQVSQADGWNAFPLDDTAQALLYGVTEETDSGIFSMGPFFTGEEIGSTLVPPIENGYYCLIDRHSDAGTPDDPGLLERGSFNCTLAVYDADTSTFYFCELDT